MANFKQDLWCDVVFQSIRAGSTTIGNLTALADGVVAALEERFHQVAAPTTDLCYEHSMEVRRLALTYANGEGNLSGSRDLIARARIVEAYLTGFKQQQSAGAEPPHAPDMLIVSVDGDGLGMGRAKLRVSALDAAELVTRLNHAFASSGVKATVSTRTYGGPDG